MKKSSVWICIVIFFIASQLHAQGAPDYGDLYYWAAHPDKEDPADRVPDQKLQNFQEESEVDVFFLHPTTHTKGSPNENWNGKLNDVALREKTNQGTILHQASIFNGAGRVFAPYYRQAHLKAYFTKKTDLAKAAFDLAYVDVKAAFEHFLANENNGRPIILASHSQGTTHMGRLMQEYFDKDPALRERLVAAYLIGMPVPKDSFDSIPLCATSEQTGCFCSWRTYKDGHLPKKYVTGDQIAVTNPLTWTTTGEKVSKTNNPGSVLAKFEKGLVPQLVGAQVHKGVLWVEKPQFPGSFLWISKNYHIADFNLFYLSVRENSILRKQTYLENRKLH